MGASGPAAPVIPLVASMMMQPMAPMVMQPTMPMTAQQPSLATIVPVNLMHATAAAAATNHIANVMSPTGTMSPPHQVHPPVVGPVSTSGFDLAKVQRSASVASSSSSSIKDSP